MKSRGVAGGLLLAWMVLGPSLSAGEAPERAAEASHQGKERLKAKDFAGALRAFADAARLEPTSRDYRTEYLLLRRAIRMRESIATQADPDGWWEMAMSLATFYYRYQVFDELRDLAVQMHARRPGTVPAMLLADVHLIQDRNAEAEQVLSTLDRTALTNPAKVLLGIALARQKKLDRAKDVLAQIVLPPRAAPRFLFDVARLRLLCGDHDGSIAALTTAFQATPPAGLDPFKAFVKNHRDFKGVAGTDTFARVLETTSKVSATAAGCSESCGSCPRAAACGACPGAAPAGPHR